MTFIALKPGSDAARLIPDIYRMFKAVPQDARTTREWAMDEPTWTLLRVSGCENCRYIPGLREPDETCTCPEPCGQEMFGRPVVVEPGATLAFRPCGGES